jgi:hypothetical protein
MATGPNHEPEAEEAGQSLKAARLALITPMLDVIFRNGKIRSFSYAYLSEVEFDPEDTLTLKFTSGVTIIIEGRGLANHREQIRLHRASEVKQCSENELALDGKDISRVEEIHITEGDMR